MRLFNTAFFHILIVVCVVSTGIFAQDTATGTGGSDDAVTVTSESLKLSTEAGWMIYTGNVRLRVGDVLLAADTIQYNRKEGIALAEGNVVLIRGEMTIASDKMTYNVRDDSGIAEFVNSYSESWYGWGREIIRVSKNEYLIKDGHVTTDPYPEPGWKIKAKEIRLFPDDKIIAKHITIYAGNVPIAYLPYYRASLKDGHSPLSVEVGYTNRWGAYALMAYDLLITEGVHSIFRVDYRNKRGWAQGIDVTTASPEGGFSEQKFYHAYDEEYRKPVDGEYVTIEDHRFRIDLRGYQPVDDTWDVRYELHKSTDEDFLKDFFRKEYKVNPEPDSYAHISKYNPNWTFNIFARKQTNDFYTTLEKLPEISMEYSSTRIGDTPFYHEGTDSLGFLRKVYANNEFQEYDAYRFDTYHRIYYPKKYMGWLNIVPGVGARGTYYGDNPEDETQTRFILDTDVKFFTKMFKIWDYENPEKGISGFRHVVEPSVHYFYTPEPNVLPEDLYQFDHIDALDYRNIFRLGFRNKFQTRRYGGTWNLIDVNTYIDYYPKPEKMSAIDDERSFSDLGVDVEIFPSRNFKVDFDAKIDTYDNEISEFNTQLSYYSSDLYGVNFEYRHRNEESNLYAAETYVTFSHKYAAKAYIRYEAETSDLEEAEITFYRDLRTWVGALSFRHRPEIGDNGEDDNQIWLNFYLKTMPQTSLLGGN